MVGLHPRAHAGRGRGRRSLSDNGKRPQPAQQRQQPSIVDDEALAEPLDADDSVRRRNRIGRARLVGVRGAGVVPAQAPDLLLRAGALAAPMTIIPLVAKSTSG